MSIKGDGRLGSLGQCGLMLGYSRIYMYEYFRRHPELLPSEVMTLPGDIKLYRLGDIRMAKKTRSKAS